MQEIECICASLSELSVRFFESVRDYTSFFNLRFNLRKIEGGEGVITKPEGLLEENKGGREGV